VPGSADDVDVLVTPSSAERGAGGRGGQSRGNEQLLASCAMQDDAGGGGGGVRPGAAAVAMSRPPRWRRRNSPSEAAPAEASRRLTSSGTCRPSRLSAAAEPRAVPYARNTHARLVKSAATAAGAVDSTPAAKAAVGSTRQRPGRAPARQDGLRPRQWQGRRRQRRRRRRRRRRQQHRLFLS